MRLNRFTLDRTQFPAQQLHWILWVHRLAVQVTSQMPKSGALVSKEKTDCTARKLKQTTVQTGTSRTVVGDTVGLPETLFGSGEETFCDTAECRNSCLSESTTCPFAHPEGPTSTSIGLPHGSVVSSKHGSSLNELKQ